MTTTWQQLIIWRMNKITTACHILCSFCANLPSPGSFMTLTYTLFTGSHNMRTYFQNIVISKKLKVLKFRDENENFRSKYKKQRLNIFKEYCKVNFLIDLMKKIYQRQLFYLNKKMVPIHYHACTFSKFHTGPPPANARQQLNIWGMFRDGAGGDLCTVQVLYGPCTYQR